MRIPGPPIEFVWGLIGMAALLLLIRIIVNEIG